MFDAFNFWFLWAALALDVATTWYVLERSGSEGNPVMRFIIDRMGVGPGLVVSHGLVGWIAWETGAYSGPHALWWLTAAFAAASAWNCYVIFRNRLTP